MAFGLYLYYQLSQISRLSAHTADFGFVSLCNCVNQFLIINLFLYIFCSVLFLRRTCINTARPTETGSFVQDC